ncbi:hypothetical protein MMC31_007880 [Peltigera leucophlebia]|nr:hypothetical protein [Peltigera leucophlebia]
MDSQTILPFLLHPVIFYLIEQLLIILILGFTSADSIIRPAFLPLLVACVWKVISICPEKIHRIPWAAFAVGTIVCNLLGYVEFALISKWAFEAQGPTSSAGPEPLQALQANRNNRGGSVITTQTCGGSFWERFRFGYFATTSTRNIGTPHVVKNTPPFSSDNPNYIPSRTAFLYRKAIIILLTFLTLDLASQAAQPLEYNIVFFSAEAVPIFTGNGENLTLGKIISRLGAVLAYWVCTFVALEGFAGLISFVFVALGIDDVRLYRPNFGPIGEAYSVRRFWSVFWHQHLRKYFTALADLIVYKAFRLPKGKLVTRYLHLSLIFFISGLVHVWIEFGQGVPVRHSGSIQFFVTQIVGIMLEDTVQAVYRTTRGVKWGTPPTLMARAVGYVWLAVFLWWSTPIWFYPQQRLSRGDYRDKILPFSLLASLLKNP